MIITFFNGNQFLSRVLESVECICYKIQSLKIEVIIVNDSPGCIVIVPRDDYKFNIRILNNSINLGIHKSRIKGVNNANYEWIQFIDQDDELCIDGYEEQIRLIDSGDFVVGNGFYYMNNEKLQIYRGYSEMKLMLKESNFFEIRNMIPSPGEVLIKKSAIPEIWLSNPLNCNGADDWYLWVTMILNDCEFSLNDKIVYIHHNSDGNNLSYDLDKMRESAYEMLERLLENGAINKKTGSILLNSINFKYLVNMKEFRISYSVIYLRPLLKNILIKFGRFIEKTKYPKIKTI